MATIGSTQTLTANGSSAAISVPAGNTTLLAGGTWGGGTITPEISADGVLWVPLKKDSSSLTTNATLTTDGSFCANLPQCLLRFTLSGATSPSIKVQAIAPPNNV